MTDVLQRRLESHLLGASRGATLADTARHMMATQAQELWGGKFALSVRTAGAPTAQEVDAAFDGGLLVRTWPFRGTLHIVAATDVEFALTVARDRVVSRATEPHRRALGLELDDYGRAERIARQALAGGPLSRADGLMRCGRRVLIRRAIAAHISSWPLRCAGSCTGGRRSIVRRAAQPHNCSD